MPIALAPVLGNPILLAAFGVDTKAPLPDQASMPPPDRLPAVSAAVPQHLTRSTWGWHGCLSLLGSKRLQDGCN